MYVERSFLGGILHCFTRLFLGVQDGVLKCSHFCSPLFVLVWIERTDCFDQEIQSAKTKIELSDHGEQQYRSMKPKIFSLTFRDASSKVCTRILPFIFFVGCAFFQFQTLKIYRTADKINRNYVNCHILSTHTKKIPICMSNFLEKAGKLVFIDLLISVHTLVDVLTSVKVRQKFCSCEYLFMVLIYFFSFS